MAMIISAGWVQDSQSAERGRLILPSIAYGYLPGLALYQTRVPTNMDAFFVISRGGRVLDFQVPYLWKVEP
jgi:hypothetical protein